MLLNKLSSKTYRIDARFIFNVIVIFSKLNNVVRFILLANTFCATPLLNEWFIIRITFIRIRAS